MIESKMKTVWMIWPEEKNEYLHTKYHATYVIAKLYILTYRSTNQHKLFSCKSSRILNEKGRQMLYRQNSVSFCASKILLQKD